MTLPKELVTVTKTSIVLTILSFVILIVLAFYLGIEYQQLQQREQIRKTTAQVFVVPHRQPTLSKESDESIDDVIMYATPSGWNRVEGNGYIGLRSPDYKENIYPFITNGAQIRIDEKGKMTTKTLEQFVAEDLPIIKGLEDQIEEEPLDGYALPLIRKHYCTPDGCTEGFYFKAANAVWQFHIECAPGCGSYKEIMKKYGAIITAFFQSIHLKENKS